MQPRFTECSYVIFQNNAPGGRELQSALRQIILVCFNLYHHTSRIPKEVEFCAYIVKNKYLLVFLSALSCSQASIKDIDLKALKCCSRPSIKKLLFLSSEKTAQGKKPPGMHRKSANASGNWPGNTKMEGVWSQMRSNSLQDPGIPGYSKDLGRLPNFFPPALLCPQAPNPSTATLIASLLSSSPLHQITKYKTS